MSIRNRLRRVEERPAVQASNSVCAIENRIETAWQEAVALLIDHRPTSRRQAALDLLVAGNLWWAPGHIDRPDEGHYIRHTPDFDNPCLRGLLNWIWRKQWLPEVEAPEAVVDAYLTFLCLMPSGSENLAGYLCHMLGASGRIRVVPRIPTVRWCRSGSALSVTRRGGTRGTASPSRRWPSRAGEHPP